MRIYKPTDRIKLQLEDVVFTVRPLSYIEKSQLMQRMIDGKGNAMNALQVTRDTIRTAICNVEGLEDEKGPWKPQFENGMLTEESLDVILSIEDTQSITSYISNFISNIPKALPEGVTRKND